MGIGYQEKLSEETTNRWWQQVYDKAASNISSTGSSKPEESDQSTIASSFAKLTDEELFKACGGRTAHKAARHGLRLNGKLERIKCQEKKLACDPSSTENQNTKKHKRKKQSKSINEESTAEIKTECEEIKIENDSAFALSPKNENIKKRRRKKQHDLADVDGDTIQVESEGVLDHSLKKKKKKQKIVCDTIEFSGDVIEKNFDSCDKKNKKHKKSKNNKTKNHNQKSN